MWSHFDDFGIGARLLRNLVHHAHKIVQRLSRLRFGRLDHQCFVNDQWEVDWHIWGKAIS